MGMGNACKMGNRNGPWMRGSEVCCKKHFKFSYFMKINKHKV